MKTNKLLKILIVPIFSLCTLMATSSLALADYLTSSGDGGEYRYELWSSDDGSYYYLKVWPRTADMNSRPYATTQSFRSSAEALNYFDCNYAKKKLPSCPG